MDRLPQVIVAQLGLRTHYAVAVLLHKMGMLAHLFTDLYSGRGSSLHIISKLMHFIPNNWKPTIVNQFLARQEDNLPPEKITAFNILGLRYALGLRRKTELAARERFILQYNKIFCDNILRHKLGNFDCIYAFQGVAQPLFKVCHDLGKVKILEHISAPKIIELELFSEEHRLWPDWAASYPSRKVWQARIDLEKDEWQMADYIICGSAFVAEGLVSLGVSAEKVQVIPYGLDIDNYKSIRAKWDGKRPLRILFLGSISLGKGVQYYHKALELLKNKQIIAKAVGPISINESKANVISNYMDIIGQVPRSEVMKHYSWADLFVSPSICEGSALVNYEALAAGLPVITTPNSGSVIRDGVDGFIVPIRNPEALAEKIQYLADNPEVLAWMSHNAQEHSLDFSWEKYGERLISLKLIIKK